jgi:CubicO group peptidase (beta-lactamase class C family)
VTVDAIRRGSGEGSAVGHGSGEESTVAERLAVAVSSGEIPGAVFVTGGPGLPEQFVIAGDARVHGGPRRPMHRDTLFDLASLTKVVATLPAVLRLAERGGLALDNRVARFLPQFTGEGRDEVTVRHLLAHTSGLAAEIRFWSRCHDPQQAEAVLRTAPLEHPPGTRTVYSDVGFMLLGRIVTAVTGAPLDTAVAELVTRPLGMTLTQFSPGPAQADQAASTELQPDGTAITGVVHDENARFFGGVSGHAGLFAPAGDLARYLTSAWLGDGLLAAATRRVACRIQTEGTGGRRGLGWVLRGDQQDSLGSRWPATSITHTGFTGTSLACDPASGHWAVLLTNEVHYGRNRGIIRHVREDVHDRCAPPLPDPPGEARHRGVPGGRPPG